MGRKKKITEENGRDTILNTSTLLKDHPPAQLRNSLIDLYFHYVTTTKDYPIDFHEMSMDIHVLVRTLNSVDFVDFVERK